VSSDPAASSSHAADSRRPTGPSRSPIALLFRAIVSLLVSRLFLVSIEPNGVLDTDFGTGGEPRADRKRARTAVRDPGPLG